MKVWEKWYGDKHTNPQMTHDAVYSMPEMNRELAKGKKLIANPGCYPTASTLGLQPMLKTGHIVENTIVIDAKSGYTGAGRRPAPQQAPHRGGEQLLCLLPSAAVTATPPRSSRTSPTSPARI